MEANNKPLDIFVGESAYLSASVTPNNATETGITWESNNTSVATVDEKGQVTAVKEGIAIILQDLLTIRRQKLILWLLVIRF